MKLKPTFVDEKCIACAERLSGKTFSRKLQQLEECDGSFLKMFWDSNSDDYVGISYDMVTGEVTVDWEDENGFVVTHEIGTLTLTLKIDA